MNEPSLEPPEQGFKDSFEGDLPEVNLAGEITLSSDDGVLTLGIEIDGKWYYSSGIWGQDLLIHFDSVLVNKLQNKAQEIRNKKGDWF